MAIDRVKVTKQAETHLAAGRLDKAIDEFLKLLEENPRDLNLMNRVGDLYLQGGKAAEAVDMFKRAGLGWERDGFHNKATAVFKKAHKAVPDDVDVAGRLADLYRQTNMIKDAIQIHIEVADHFTKKGLIKRALDEFAKVVELDPKNMKNKVKLADLYNKEGMKDRAATIYLEVAEALAIEQMHAEANQILERAKAMVTTPQVYLTQSRLCVIQKDLAGAAARLREGLAANPRSSEILEALAEIELQSRNPENALEALGQVPQLPEKLLGLCERALRELVKARRTDEGLRLFKAIGRDFARRGLGDNASRAIRSALQGQLNAEAWLQLAEIAHQSGNKADHLNALRQAHSEAVAAGDRGLAETVAGQLTALGMSREQIDAQVPSEPSRASGTPAEAIRSLPTIDSTEVDPVKRMQIEQLQRDAEAYLRNRFLDRAQDAYVKVLELDPTNRDAILRIADIIKASGKMTAVQMHFVKTAERLVPMGQKELALDLLDRAEALFPGSTRLYRRTLGLMDMPSPAAAAPAAPPQAAAQPPIALAIPLPAPAEPMPASIPLAAPAALAPPSQVASDLDVLIALDLPGAEPPAPPLRLAPPAPAIPLPPPPAVEPIALASTDLDLAALASAPLEELEPLELEPLPFAEGKVPMAPTAFPQGALPFPTVPAIPLPPPPEPTVPAAVPAAPAPAPASAAPAHAPAVEEELASLLSDIDFQLDYGSPEEAKLELQNALATWPGHPELERRMERAEEALHRLGHAASPARTQEEDEEIAHSFFDLTDVLGDALMESGEGEEMHDATNVVEKIQSVDELFSAFREGVEQQVKVDDYDTHYNLGIAYKEMMLIEPALEEFKKAMRDPERTLECCSMLSICEQSQGNLDAAVQWLRQGIDAPGWPPEDSIGLRYDLGVLLEQMGQPEAGRAEFRRVHELDPEYRDVAARI